MSVFNGPASAIEDNRNKVSTIDGNSSDEQYPSAKATHRAISIEQKRVNNTFANALKGNASSTTITLDDVSPITHEMSVKISSDTVTDLTAVKVKKLGKNLFDTSKLQNVTFETYSDIPCFSYYDNENYFIYTDNFIKDAQYTFTTKAYREDGVINKPIGIKLVYTDGTTQTEIINAGEKVSVTSIAGKTLTKITGNNGYWLKCYIDLSVTQLEIGTTASEYEPYKECVEYTPNTDGTVNGVTSLYPNTALMTDTDGVIIDCEYNKDINKAFAELTQAIISLGGNI